MWSFTDQSGWNSFYPPSIRFFHIGVRRILKIMPDRAFSVVSEYNGVPDGLQIHVDERIFITNFHRGLPPLNFENGAARRTFARRLRVTRAAIFT